ncbi:uncharacterized protein [Chelonus insularis]|uniref:uncharacterized protein n=1 Tax=Chelonus insularis TaxID=460826 RepID=UPI00158A4FF8|nr:uncharacterized protein LOC118073064 [Chelonus insularis]
MFYSNIYGILVILTIVNARIVYVDPSRDYYSNKHEEQASKDLDMTFFAGDPSEFDEKEYIYPFKKVYFSPERPIVDMTHEMDYPVYYKMSEVTAPKRKIIYSDVSPWQRTPKVMYLNNPKGEIVLELRVSANSNNNNYSPKFV